MIKYGNNMKLELDITPPEGYEVVGICIPSYGDIYANLDEIACNGNLIGDIHKKDISNNINTCKLILKKKKQKKEIIIFESTGEFREPNKGDFFRINNEFPLAMGYKTYELPKVGNKKIFRCIKSHTYED